MANKVKVWQGMTGDDLREWRRQQPGEYDARNGEKRPGWSQEQCADWYGCAVRTWQRYEYGEKAIPLPLVRRLQSYRRSFEETIDRIMDVPKANLTKWGSPFEELADEDSAGRDITRPSTGFPKPPTMEEDDDA